MFLFFYVLEQRKRESESAARPPLKRAPAAIAISTPPLRAATSTDERAPIPNAAVAIEPSADTAACFEDEENSLFLQDSQVWCKLFL